MSMCICIFTGASVCFYAKDALAENLTFEKAGEAARQVTVPNFSDFLTQQKMNETLPPSSFGDTSGLSDLRGEKGLGDIKTPGLNKAIACDTKNDPECLAIQMLRYGSANNPKLDETTEAQIKNDHQSVITNKDSILGDLTNLGSKERVCETVETVIPGQSATEICDITTGSGTSQGMCEEGWEENKSLLVYYLCTMNALDVTNACTVKTTALTHTEDIYQCTDRSATYETRTCDVPATVTVKKTYPYTCPITMAEATKKRCVKTLEVITTPTCNGGAGQDISLRVKTFTDYGWTADPWERSFKAHMSCGTSLTDFTLTIQSSIYNGTVTSAPFTTRSTSYGLDFIISFRVFEKNYMPHWEVSVTNIDAGLGSITLVDSIPFRLINHQERDVWTETCEEIP